MSGKPFGTTAGRRPTPPAAASPAGPARGPFGAIYASRAGSRHPAKLQVSQESGVKKLLPRRCSWTIPRCFGRGDDALGRAPRGRGRAAAPRLADGRRGRQHAPTERRASLLGTCTIRSRLRRNPGSIRSTVRRATEHVPGHRLSWRAMRNSLDRVPAAASRRRRAPDAARLPSERYGPMGPNQVA